MKSFSKLTIAYLLCSAALFMAGTTLLPAAGLGGLVRDVLMLSVCGIILYGLLSIQSARADAASAVPETEAESAPKVVVGQPVVRAMRDQEIPLQRAA